MCIRLKHTHYYVGIVYMNYIYASMYVVTCVILFFVIFKSDETFHFLFKTKINDITDHNHPEFTGGMTCEFNPMSLF